MQTFGQQTIFIKNEDVVGPYGGQYFDDFLKFEKASISVERFLSIYNRDRRKFVFCNCDALHVSMEQCTSVLLTSYHNKIMMEHFAFLLC